MSMVRKIMPVTVRRIDEQRAVISFLGTTPTKDRYGDVVKPHGAQTKAYRANPVFLWAHNYAMMPIGKSLGERITMDGMEFEIQFDLQDPMGAQAFRKYKEGYLTATSIGFMPLEYEPVDGGGYTYNKWELLELSAVPVPANPDALMMALAKGMEEGGDPNEVTDEIMSWATTLSNSRSEVASPLMEAKAADPEDTNQGSLLDKMETALDAVDELVDQLRTSVEADAENEPDDPLDELMLAFVDELETKLDDVDETIEDLRKILDVDSMDEASKAAAFAMRGLRLRAGAVLNKTNKSRLLHIKTLVDEVLASAEKADASDDEVAPEEAKAVLDEPIIKATEDIPPVAFDLPEVEDPGPPNPATTIIEPALVAQVVANAVRSEVARILGKAPI